MSWRMPAETAPQKRVWMAFPPKGCTAGDTPDTLDEARTAWSGVAHAIADFEPVTIIVDPADRDIARRYLSSAIEQLEAPLDDAWMRDIGPSFVLNDQGQLGGVDWRFNGWGAREWATWAQDDHIAAFVIEQAGAARIESSLVNEGGGIHVDGAGTVLLSDSVQRDPRRNPGISRAAVEAEMARTIGVTHCVWLERGLWRDSAKFGTFGHVDIVATLTEPGRILLHEQRDASHPDHAICEAAFTALSTARAADGQCFDITRLPAPRMLRDDEDFVDYSYINHLVINNAVIACTFDDPADADALSILAEAYPGRRIVGVDARPIFARGGGVHCITQQEPAIA